jgi:Tol biopolymer transport system component
VKAKSQLPYGATLLSTIVLASAASAVAVAADNEWSVGRASVVRNGRVLIGLYRPNKQDRAFFSLRPNGTNRSLVATSVVGIAGDYSPDGRQLVLSEPHALLFMTAAGRIVTKIASGSLLLTSRPSWAPSGTFIAVTARGSNETHDGLYVLDIHRRRWTRLARSLWIRNDPPSWSVDSRTVLVSGAAGIYGVNTKSGKRALRIRDDAAHGAAYSPDGKRIAYLHSDLPCMADIGCTDFLRITSLHRAATQVGGQAEQPEWSPDGRYLLYTKQFGPELGHLFKLDLASRRRTDLTPGVGSKQISWPSWQTRCRGLGAGKQCK